MDANPLRAARLYRAAGELQNADALNNFGLCLERGVGVKSNPELAAGYYRRSAELGHADGANNFGFCLEHGRGVAQDFCAAERFYKLALELGHPEVGQNQRRCLRLLGRWEGPDRSAHATDERPPFPGTRAPPIADFGPSLAAFEETKSTVDLIKGWEIGAELGWNSATSVRLARDPARGLQRAVKTSLTAEAIADLKRESAGYADLDHPLVLGFEGFIPGPAKRPAAIVTEFAGNGSLVDHLGALPSPTRVAVIVVGIAMAMRYLHSRQLIHRNLRPETVFLARDWTIRIGGFADCICPTNPAQTESPNMRGDFRYVAPECFDNAPTLRSDVFSFGLILCALLGGNPVFWDGLTPLHVIKAVVIDKRRPAIPDSVAPRVRRLIKDCWRQRQDRRPSFEWILRELKEMNFRVTAGVNSAKVRRFVEAVEGRERALGLWTDGFPP